MRIRERSISTDLLKLRNRAKENSSNDADKNEVRTSEISTLHVYHFILFAIMFTFVE